MKGQVIGKNMTHGYAGDYARQPDMIVDTHPLGGNNAVTFGLPLVYDADSKVVAFGASSTASDFVGIASREFKSATSYLVPGSCTHRPSHHGSRKCPKPVTQPFGGSCRRWSR